MGCVMAFALTVARQATFFQMSVRHRRKVRGPSLANRDLGKGEEMKKPTHLGDYILALQL